MDTKGNNRSAIAHVEYLPQPTASTIHQVALLLLWVFAVLAYLAKFGSILLWKEVHGQAPTDSQDCTDNVRIDIEQDKSKPQNGHIAKSPTAPAAVRRPAKLTGMQFLTSVMQLGLIMLFFYLCDYDHMFVKAERIYSRDLFCFLILLLVLASWYFTTSEADGHVLNRHQTEEWKGWMQVMFVWYHYYRAAEIYNAIRIFIAAYVWMTGFGNFSYFWVRKDFSLYRMLKMLWRLNFLVVIVCIATNNSYMLYYICAMHTFWFLSVYVMMRPFHQHNENKHVMTAKFFVYFLVVFAIFDVPGVAEVVFRPLSFILSFDGSLHEWIFRCGLDHYCTFVGMICAYFHPNIEKFLAKLEARLSKEAISWNDLRKCLIAMVTGIVFVAWYKGIYVLPKYEYNRLHPYTSFIPVLSWILLRNSTATLRSWHLGIFAWLGKVTLETYICQLHIYMQGNAKYLIVYIPGYPLLNFTFATAVYLFVSHRLFYLTVSMGDFVIDRELRTTLKHGIVFMACTLLAYMLAYSAQLACTLSLPQYS